MLFVPKKYAPFKKIVCFKTYMHTHTYINSFFLPLLLNSDTFLVQVW